MNDLSLFEQKDFSVNELAKFLDMAEGKDTDRFYSSILNYTDFIDFNKDEPVGNIRICNSKESWVKIASALASEISLYPDMSIEKSYKDIVSQANKGFETGDVECFNATVKEISNILIWARTAMWSVISHTDYERAKRYFETPLKKNVHHKDKKDAKEIKSFVYIAKQLNEKNLYKIGCTDDISKRLGTFKTGNCFVEMVASKPVQDKYFSEKWLHNYFRAKKYKNEWFLLDSDDLKELAEIFDFNFHLKNEA